jgi:RimJ/RimL family protein N-acetyltransferase
MIKIKLIKKSVDTKQWVKWLNDKEITKFSEQRLKKHTVKSQKKFLLGKIKAENSKLFQIFYKNQFVGLVELGFIDRFHKICEVMYFLGNKNYWGKKIATTAVSLAIKYAFKNLGMHKVYAGTYGKNKSSQKVLKNNNFKLVGVMKNHFRLSKLSLKRDDKYIYEKIK